MLCTISIACMLYAMPIIVPPEPAATTRRRLLGINKWACQNIQTEFATDRWRGPLLGWDDAASGETGLKSVIAHGGKSRSWADPAASALQEQIVHWWRLSGRWSACAQSCDVTQERGLMNEQKLCTRLFLSESVADGSSQPMLTPNILKILSYSASCSRDVLRYDGTNAPYSLIRHSKGLA